MATVHDWTQTDSEVVLKIPVDASVGKEKLKITIESSRVSVLVAGSAIFNNELSSKIVVDDSYWQLEGGADSRKLVVTLCKKKSAKWRTLTKDEDEAIPAKDVLDDDFDVLNLEHDDDDPERVEEQEENERKLEARYKKLREEKGLDNEDTLQTFFALFDNCIQLYRLNKLSDYLDEVLPVCRKRNDKYKLKAIQAVAFVKWKQSKFREALPLFHEMEEILGKGAALCENIAHTYNSMGDYEKAEDYFRQSLRFIEQEHGSNQGNRGGVLLGLGLVRDRLGKHREALPVVKKAYDFYKERANGAPASLQAKAGISCAKLHAKLGELPQAEQFIREAVQMYEVTCGETSPLTASAYHELGKCLWKQRKRADAQKALKRAYEIESMKDAWDLVTLLEIHNLLMDTHLKETDHIERSKFVEYFKTVEYIASRVRKELPQDGNAAVYYKAAAELKAWGGSYNESKDLFNMAIPLFEKETTTDCSGLIASCQEMLAFCDRNLQGKQNSPMDFEIPNKATDGSGSAGGGGAEEGEGLQPEGVKIEEVLDDEPVTVTAGSSSAAAAAAAAAAPAAPAPVAAKTPPPAVPPPPPACTFRAAVAGDASFFISLCSACGCEPLLPDQAAIERHLAGPGAGICWVAERDGTVVAFCLCGSDGVYGQLLQITAAPGGTADDVRRDLADRCADACLARGLRALRAAVPVESDDGLFERLGWSVSHAVYGRARDERPQKKSRVAGLGASEASAASSSSGGEARSKLKPEGKDTRSFYNAWDKVNVDKVLIEEEGGDPAVVPEVAPTQDEFQQQFGILDVATRISRFAWDQSDKFVSIYVPWDGVGALGEECVECHFRRVGVLLLVRSGGKTHWYKVINLCKEIDVEASKRNIKADQVVIKLKKVQTGEKWSDLTDEKDKYQKRREYRINHGDLKGATTEELLADMYQHASDEDRAGLRDAMKVNREKREEDARRAAGK